MVLHDRGYHRWDGNKTAPVRGLGVIAERGVSTALTLLFKRKLFAQLLSFAAFGPFLVGLGIQYLHFFFSSHPELYKVAENMGESGMLDLVTPNPDTVWGYLFQIQKGFVLLLCVLVGAGLIAEDRRSNALELYLSRPLGLRDYLLGKLIIIGLFLAMVTAVPACILVLVQMMLRGHEPGVLAAQADLLWRTPMAAGVLILTMSLLVLAASSLAQRARNAAILFIGTLVVVEGVVAGLLQEVFRDATFKLVLIDFQVGQVMAWVLNNELEIDPDVPVGLSAAVLGGWLTLALVVILRRVRPVEVVA